MEREMRKKGEVGRGKETGRSIVERKGKSEEIVLGMRSALPSR